MAVDERDVEPDYQHLDELPPAERPRQEREPDGETVYATAAEPAGEQTVENVPMVESEPAGDDPSGQTEVDDFA